MIMFVGVSGRDGFDASIAGVESRYTALNASAGRPRQRGSFALAVPDEE